MVFPKAWGYAVRALLYLDEHQKDGYLLGSEIAEKKSIPAPFMSKILGILAAAGLLDSQRGRHGGFHLSRPLHEIALQEILQLLEPYNEDQCILGDGKCQGKTDCPIHDSWAPLRHSIDQFLENTTLADLKKDAALDKTKIQAKNQIYPRRCT